MGEPEEYNKAPDHLKGISLVQFIKTSNITIHTLDTLKRVYLNIFSCKHFDPQKVLSFSEAYFNGSAVSFNTIVRL
jgi:S-adenosylmethionine/arginine decarboxylase-like enzyme